MHDHVSGVWAMHSDHKEVSRSAAILWCVPILSRPPACLLRSRCTVETFPCKMLREPLRSPVRATGAHCMQSPVMVHGCSCYAIPRHGSREHRRSPSVKEVFGVPLLLRRCLRVYVSKGGVSQAAYQSPSCPCDGVEGFTSAKLIK